MGEEGWERARVVAGRPAPPGELRADVSPFQAGLLYAVRPLTVHAPPLYCSPGLPVLFLHRHVDGCVCVGGGGATGHTWLHVWQIFFQVTGA
jgi:hypothetical protein